MFSSTLEWKTKKKDYYKYIAGCGGNFSGSASIWYLPAGANAEHLFNEDLLTYYKIAKGVTTVTPPSFM